MPIHCKAFIIVMLILEYIPIEAINYIAEPMLRQMSAVHIKLLEAIHYIAGPMLRQMSAAHIKLLEAIDYIAEPMLRLMSVVHIELVITVTEQIRLVAAAVSALSN